MPSTTFSFSKMINNPILAYFHGYYDLNLQNHQKIIIFPDINFPKNHRKSQNLRSLRITNFEILCSIRLLHNYTVLTAQRPLPLGMWAVHQCQFSIWDFWPLHFPIFEANPKYLTGTSCILLKFRVWGCPIL